MKLQSLFLTALCAIGTGFIFTACSDDDANDDWQQGAKVELSQTRAFILNEGSMGHNNANLIYFDWNTKAVNTECIYTQQNGQQLGDTGNDIIAFEGKMAVAVNGSNYITLLNGSGVELSRMSCVSMNADGADPQVRNLAYADGYLYVTTYGGFLYKVKVDANELVFSGYLNLGANLEGITIADNKIYCVIAGQYPENDERIAIVPLDNFKDDAVTYAKVMYNPDHILSVDGRIFVQGYGQAYDYPFGEYNTSTGEYVQLGNAVAWAAGEKVIYLANSVTDWTTYVTTTTLSVYDLATGQLRTDFFSDVPAAITSAFVYSISVNPYNGEIFVATSDYVNDGVVYCFSADGTYKNMSFSSNGLNPNKIVFLK